MGEAYLINMHFLSEARPKAERSLELGWLKKKRDKKKGTTTSTTNFVPGQTIHFLVEVFTFLFLFQPPPQTFSYVFDFHKLSKRHSEKTIFAKKFFWKKKIKKNYSFFFFRFFFSNCFFFEFFFFRIFFFSNFFFSNFFFFELFFFEFFLRFFFSLSKTYSTAFSFYLIVIYFLPTKKRKRSKKRFARPVF